MTPTDGAEWWRSAVVYQIYPRSFADSDGDGVGDLRGVIAHLDHLVDLGIGVIWLGPVYPSSQADNGYDITDYQDIDPVFGSLEDLDALLAAIHARGMRLILDLVVNHSSHRHPWFVESRRSTVNPYADWYFWRDPRPGTVGGQPGAEPNNWGAAFSGPAWTWVPERAQYYLHLFSPSQPDLNWENAEVRDAVFSMMNWWLDRGIDGFRMDVINFIAKDRDLPDVPAPAGGYGDGMPHFANRPELKGYLREMNERVFDPRPGRYLRVGEMPHVSPEQAREFTDTENALLAMVFQFDHVSLDQQGDKWTPRTASVNDLRDTLVRWQLALSDGGWNSLYWNNHDQPRVVSRYGNDTTFWRESATALATVLHLHRGTPYVYQGEEIGMTNMPFDSIADLRDVESLAYYAAAVDGSGADPAAAMAALRRQSRDNARTPMQWTGAAGAGFSDGTPWIAANPNHSWLNVAAQRDDPGSIYQHYKALIALRHSRSVLVMGGFRVIETGRDQIYAFARTWGDETVEVYANLSNSPISFDLASAGGRVLLLTNYHESDPESEALRPWEARVYEC
ncbi:oligo-1,6-glucosidase [Nocardioides baekrokdamisoli]|uniref:Oligo-1,6-glucosidase n=1 Tax=Nocardioides baekrokdamisoli TaxID=1804624 RepID=A0A3G9ICL6_9ACTN|nr:alpha-glucosidase [Nocardioides baekrokdamisoli]BBH16690.1 oligo-1,6-glucosidase [Nocardioides baekrokdamisoli]